MFNSTPLSVYGSIKSKRSTGWRIQRNFSLIPEPPAFKRPFTSLPKLKPAGTGNIYAGRHMGDKLPQVHEPVLRLHMIAPVQINAAGCSAPRSAP